MKHQTATDPRDIEAICRDCARKRGWTPVPFAVGVWTGTCDDCGETKRCTAPRDYRYSQSNPLGR